MSATVQTSIFDFKPIVRPRAEPARIRIPSSWEKGGYSTVYRTDALSIVNSLGRPFDGKALSDTRVLHNNYHGATLDELYYHSGVERDMDRPLDSWLQCCGYIFKLIGDGTITDVLNLTTYNRNTHDYDRDYREISAAWIDGDLLCIDTADGGRFSADILEDSEMDSDRIARNDPTVYTESLVNEALKAGVPMDELRWFNCHSTAYAVHCYGPFTRDWTTGMLVRNPQFDEICALAERLGIMLKLCQDVPKPQPEKWDILPAFWKNYCAHTRGCKRKTESGCVCCDRFLYNREPVQKKHLDMPGKKSSVRGCDPEECE